MFQNMNPLGTSTAIWEILIMLIWAFILGYFFSRYLCNCGEKKMHSMAEYTWAKDDIKIIEGIGPSIERILNAAWIWSFTQIAGMDVRELKKILDDANFWPNTAETWWEQAWLLRDGKMEEFEKLTDELKGGRRV